MRPVVGWQMVGIRPSTNGHAKGARPPAPPQPARFEFVDSAEFLTADYGQRFLIPRVLVAGQPGVVAGPSKAMKTSLVIDMAVSLATGAKFLNEFPVPVPVRVAVVSGESGKATLQETARRVLDAKKLTRDALADRLQWCFDLPQFNDLGDMAAFAERLKSLAADVVFIDPVYLCLGGNIDHANLFEMGAAFRVVADVLLKAGVTPVLVHHANRQLRTGDPMELTHLAYAGLEQFARQFVLMNRQTAYQGDGVHDLSLSAGGSAGHGGQWSLRIEEGTVDERFRGRFWRVAVKTPEQDTAAKIDRKKADADERQRKKLMTEETNLLRAIDVAARDKQPCTKTFVKNRHPNLKGPVLDEAAARLLVTGEVEVFECPVAGGHGSRQRATAYRRGAKRER